MINYNISASSRLPTYAHIIEKTLPEDWIAGGTANDRKETPKSVLTTTIFDFEVSEATGSLSLTVVTSTPAAKSEVLAREKSLRRLEALFAEWDDEPDTEQSIDDNWLRDLRAGWGKRLDDLYGLDDR